MLQIEPIEEVITRHKVMVTLDEDEIAKILVDPRAFQKALRAQKHAWNGHGSTWSLTGHAGGRGGRGVTKKSARKVKKAGPKEHGRLKCQWGCGKHFTNPGWKIKHEAICEQRDIGTVKTE